MYFEFNVTFIHTTQSFFVFHKYQDPHTSGRTVDFDQVSLKAGFHKQQSKVVAIIKSADQDDLVENNQHTQTQNTHSTYDSVSYDLVKTMMSKLQAEISSIVVG